MASPHFRIFYQDLGSISSGQKTQMNIATWNVQTVMDNYISERPERRTAFLACDLRLDVDIAALQETRLADEGQLTEIGGVTPFSGKARPLQNRESMVLDLPSRMRL